MDVLGFIVGTAAAILAVLGWGLTGAALSRIRRLEQKVAELERRR